MRFITPEGNLSGPMPAGHDVLPCTLRGERVGAFLNPPPLCITDVHRRALALLRQGRVLVIYIDGLGYDLYRRAQLPFIRKTFRCAADAALHGFHAHRRAAGRARHIQPAGSPSARSLTDASPRQCAR